MKLLYFAWLKTETGCSEEDVELPEGVGTVAELLDWLDGRSEGHRAALADHDRDLPQGTSGNMYHLPDGRVVDADTPLYDPSVVGDPEDLFGG